MKFRIITDTHYGKNGYCNGNLRRLSDFAKPIITEVVTLTENSETELLFQLGDLIEDQDLEKDKDNYLELVDLFNQTSKTVIHIPGNHDLKLLGEKFFLQIFKKEKLTYSLEKEGIKFIIVKTDLVNDFPIVADEDLEILEKELSQSKLPVVILSHHPFADNDITGNLGWYEPNQHRALIKNRLKVRQIISDSKKVVCCFNGHLHANYILIHDDIPYITIQSATDNYKSDGTPALSHAEIEISLDKLIINVFGNDSLQKTIDFKLKN